MNHNYEMQRIFMGEGVIIYANREHKLVELVWKGCTSSVEFKEAAFALVDLTRKWKIDKWLVDQKNMMIYPQDFEWALKEIYPELIKFGQKKSVVSIVLSDNLFGEFSIKKALNQYFPKGNLRVAYFDNPGVAWNWLLEVDQDFGGRA